MYSSSSFGLVNAPVWSPHVLASPCQVYFHVLASPCQVYFQPKPKHFSHSASVVCSAYYAYYAYMHTMHTMHTLYTMPTIQESCVFFHIGLITIQLYLSCDQCQYPTLVHFNVKEQTSWNFNRWYFNRCATLIHASAIQYYLSKISVSHMCLGAITGIQIYKCTNVQMYKCTNILKISVSHMCLGAVTGARQRPRSRPKVTSRPPTSFACFTILTFCILVVWHVSPTVFFVFVAFKKHRNLRYLWPLRQVPHSLLIVMT